MSGGIQRGGPLTSNKGHTFYNVWRHSTWWDTDLQRRTTFLQDWSHWGHLFYKVGPTKDNFSTRLVQLRTPFYKVAPTHGHFKDGCQQEYSHKSLVLHSCIPGKGSQPGELLSTRQASPLPCTAELGFRRLLQFGQKKQVNSTPLLFWQSQFQRVSTSFFCFDYVFQNMWLRNGGNLQAPEIVESNRTHILQWNTLENDSV